MIRKLRRRFVILAASSLLFLFVLILAISSLLNYYELRKNADRVIDFFQEEIEHTPNGRPEEAFDNPDFDKKPMQIGMSPEISYESRYFAVLIDENGEMSNLYMEHIVSVDEDEAAKMANRVLDKGKKRGYVSGFRYSVQNYNNVTCIVFLDCGRKFDVFWTNVTFQTVISLIGLVVLCALLLHFSRILTRPVEEAHKKQKEFISVAGHELKTPLTIIDADSELLRMELANGNEWLDDISIQTKRLANLTNDLIRLTKLDEVSDTLAKIDFPFSDVVSETIQSFQAVAEQNKIPIKQEIEPMISYYGDEKSLRQLVGILIDNAIKYSKDSSPVYIYLLKKTKEVILIVRNSTEDLKDEQIAKVFDRFYRAEQSNRFEKGGYGLGLAIAKGIVDAHDGKIVAASPEKNVFEITVTLPI